MDLYSREDALRLFAELGVVYEELEWDVQPSTVGQGGHNAVGVLRLEFLKFDARNNFPVAYNRYSRKKQRDTGERPSFRVAKDKSPLMLEDDKDTQARVDYHREQSIKTHGQELNYRKRDNDIILLFDDRSSSSAVPRDVVNAILHSEVVRLRELRTT